MARNQATAPKTSEESESWTLKGILTFWLYRLALWLVPRLPERFGYWLFACIGDLYLYVNSRARQIYFNNLNRILGADARQLERRLIARHAAQNLGKNYFDLFRGHRLSGEQVMAEVQELSGVEHLEAAIAAGKGIVGGSAHFGNFNMFVYLASVYMRDKSPVIVPVERLRPARVFDMLSKLRASQGITVVPADSAGRMIIKKLREGALIGLALDYDVTGSGQIMDFFGAPARLPDGAAALAVKYNVPLIIGFIRRLDNNKCTVVIEPPLEIDRTDDLAHDTRITLSRIIARMEEWIRKYPEQWLMFQPLWEEDKSAMVR